VTTVMLSFAAASVGERHELRLACGAERDAPRIIGRSASSGTWLRETVGTDEQSRWRRGGVPPAELDLKLGLVTISCRITLRNGEWVDSSGVTTPLR